MAGWGNHMRTAGDLAPAVPTPGPHFPNQLPLANSRKVAAEAKYRCWHINDNNSHDGGDKIDMVKATLIKTGVLLDIPIYYPQFSCDKSPFSCHTGAGIECWGPSLKALNPG